MSTHPVRLAFEPVAERQRVHLLIRASLLVALGVLHASAIPWIAYLFAPAVVALRVSQVGGARYLAEDAPRIAKALRWIAQACAYLWLLTDEPPAVEGGAIGLEIEPGGAPSAGSAVVRLIASIPALLLLGLLCLVLTPVWLIGFLAILIAGRLPGFLGDLLALTLRYQMRLLAYHLSLVDRYPSFEVAPPEQVAPPAPV